MSPEAKDFYEKSFRPKYEKLIGEVRKTPLMVLVWGPGEHGGDLYEKRLQIRGELRTWGHSALFSEEIDQHHPAPDLSSKAREMLQALSADFIVVLQGSPGSTAEVHDAAGLVEKLGHKMLIFVDERHVGGYSYTGALRDLNTLYRNVETYKYPDDIQECFLIQTLQEKVGVLQWTKWCQARAADRS